ncbi:centromere protein J [Ostrinia nubilalis]|uniref:centromere protein J n=1 Tax=Ostrinia nubilalis TaxID=29057 RepID=UPI0030826191
MDQSYSESDVSLSPSQLLERLQVLRQLQLLQRGKLQKQRLEYQETSETSSSVTEIVSHFSNSTSYNTFRSLLESAHDSSTDGTPRLETRGISQKVKERDLIEGVSMLNLSQESEFIVNSPVSSRSRKSVLSRNEDIISPRSNVVEQNSLSKKHIALDDMPILSPKKDFEALLMEKLQVEKTVAKAKSPQQTNKSKNVAKKPFLRKGEGMSRFGLQKKDLVIQNTKALPWRRQSLENKNVQSPLRKEINKLPKSKDNKANVEIIVTKPQSVDKNKEELKESKNNSEITNTTNEKPNNHNLSENVESALRQLMQKPLTLPTGKHPLKNGKGNTWASVLSKEQNDFLKQLKQSDYYKNFTSPAKSIVSDVSCDEALCKLSHERETAEQNMFDLLESKVSHESFSLENSFFNKFLRKSKLECSGESTPLVMQHCLANNPDLMHIYPNLNRKRNQNSQSDVETCNSECADCCSETCSSASSCCSCKTVEEKNNTVCTENNKKEVGHKGKTKTTDRKGAKEVPSDNDKDKNDAVNANDSLQSNMVEMNSKLIATSELLKDRLRELEDEIETFRKENANLTKMREEIDVERQKFYEEKSMFEQKFHEEKIMSEYYLAEEKEKLTKQKQMYDKYVREMRGRLNKKDKDEVLNLRKEINDLKEEIRVKDAKSTSTIARLRNQIKLMEKEKKAADDEIEKLKKENRRIQHSNDMTRRMTNIKYLEQINKKLSNMTAKETRSEVTLDSNAKYKTFEIERQSRSRKVPSNNADKVMRTRAKSVPNLNVTSRYAKYFSQRDAGSDFERNRTVNIEALDKYDYTSDIDIENEILNDCGDSIQSKENSDPEDDNNLEKLYMERFHSVSPKSSRSNISNPSTSYISISNNNPDTFFISKSNSNRDSRSPSNTVSPFNNSNESLSNRSKSSSTLSHRSSDQRSPRDFNDDICINRDTSKNLAATSRSSSKSQSKSPVSILTNRSSVLKPETVIHNENYMGRLPTVSSNPSSSKSSLTKTNLNPIEIKKPDGSRELRFPNGNMKFLSSDGKYSKFVYYNGDVKENFYTEGRIKYFYADTKTYHTTHADGLEVLEFIDGQVEKRYKDGSTEIRLPNGSVRYFDPKNEHVREEWRFPDGAALTISASGEQRVVFSNGQVEVHTKDHKRREFPDGTVKLVYNDGTSETRYASGRVRIKDKHGNVIMDSATG